MSATPRIRITDLAKAFGSNRVLSGVNLAVAAGESLVVIGGSGSGKSVLAKCLIGLMEADAGKIEIDGQDLATLPRREREAVRQRVGMLFQGGALFDSIPVLDNVAFGLIRAQHRPKKEALAIAREKLAEVGLGAEVANLYPGELSGGMRKRVALARTIATEPKIILFDEPTTGLDPIMGDLIDRLILKSVRELGATALTITHDMKSARRIGDRIAMLYDGAILWDGPAAEVDQSGNAALDQFVHGRLTGPIDVAVRPT